MLTNDTITECQWIGNSPILKPSCNCEAIEGRSYCTEHVWLVYQEGSAVRKRKKDIRRAEAYWNLESEFHDAVAELVEEGEIEL